MPAITKFNPLLSILNLFTCSIYTVFTVLTAGSAFYYISEEELLVSMCSVREVLPLSGIYRKALQSRVSIVTKPMTSTSCIYLVLNSTFKQQLDKWICVPRQVPTFSIHKILAIELTSLGTRCVSHCG